MRRLYLIAVLLSGCGTASHDDVLIGQVKNVENVTPAICKNYIQTKINDSWLMVLSEADGAVLAMNAEMALRTRIHYHVLRFSPCGPAMLIDKIETIE